MMKFRIPFAFSSLEVLNKRSKSFVKFIRKRKQRESKLSNYLVSSGLNLRENEYRAICLRNLVINFTFLSILFISILFISKIKLFYLYGLGIAFLFSAFLFFNQINYPKIYAFKKTNDIEKNLIAAMQDMLVQLNSGVPVFKILSNLASAKYGVLSNEFSVVIREINSGMPQIDALESLSKRNDSIFFRRVLWQISSGMRSGADLSIIIREGIKNLNREQAVQIQTYGSKLNPLVMFYMLFTVILPSLGLTFMIIISSLLGFSENIIKMMFGAVFVLVVFVQIMFIGIIKNRRPSLL